MEQVFFRLHVRSVSLFSGLFHTKSREFFEKILLVSACLFLALLVGLHTNFVNLNQDNNCLRYLVNKDNVSLQDFDIIRIYVSNEKLQDNLIKLPQLKAGRNATGIIIPYNHEQKLNDIDNILSYSFEGKILDNKSVTTEETKSKDRRFDCPIASTDTDVTAAPLQCSQERSPSATLDGEISSTNTSTYPTVTISSLYFLRKAARTLLSSSFFKDYIRMERLYIFSLEKAFLLLPHTLRQKHNLSQASITVSKHSSCFGNTGITGVGSGLAWMVHNIIGYDTIVMNWLITEFEGRGFLYNTNSREIYNLNLSTEFKRDRQGWSHILFYKVGILFTTLFLFFTTTTLVSFTLRETQERMLKFTHLLQHYVRHRLPYAPLVLTHVVESLVFVPIMIGILFFLFEFFSDQLLAFLVMSLVWMAEVFSVVSVRTQPSIRFFPRAFFLYFSLFHIYFFSFPFGYSYIALLTTTLFLQHSMMHCWNHFEVAALHSGVVSATRPREVAGLLGWMQLEGEREGGLPPLQTAGGNGGHSLAYPQYTAESTVTAGGRRERRNSEPEWPLQPLRGTRSRRDSDPSPSSNSNSSSSSSQRFQYSRLPLAHHAVTSLPSATTAASAAGYPSPSLSSTMTTVDHVELSRRIQQHQITELINYNANINAAETLRSQDTTSAISTAISNSRAGTATSSSDSSQRRSDRYPAATPVHTSGTSSSIGTSSSTSGGVGHFSPTRSSGLKVEVERASPPRPGVSSYLWSTFWSQSSAGGSGSGALLSAGTGVAGVGVSSASSSSVFSPGRSSSSASSKAAAASPRPPPLATGYRRHRIATATASTTSTAHNTYSNPITPSDLPDSSGVGGTLSSPFPEVVARGDARGGKGGGDGSGDSSRRKEGAVAVASSRDTHPNSLEATPSSPSSGKYGYGYNTSSFTVFGTDLYDSALADSENESSVRNSSRSSDNNDNTVCPSSLYNSRSSRANANSRSDTRAHAFDRMDVASSGGNETSDEQIGMSEFFM